MNKDWTGSEKSVFKTLGSSHHASHERAEFDYYATDPLAVRLLLQIEQFSKKIKEPACGEGHISKVLEDAGHEVHSSDLIDRGYGEAGINFLSYDNRFFDGDIITNPPYKYAKEFVQKSLEIIPVGNKVAMFLKVQFLEGKERKKLFTKAPPVSYMSHRRA